MTPSEPCEPCEACEACGHSVFEHGPEGCWHTDPGGVSLDYMDQPPEECACEVALKGLVDTLLVEAKAGNERLRRVVERLVEHADNGCRGFDCEENTALVGEACLALNEDSRSAVRKAQVGPVGALRQDSEPKAPQLGNEASVEPTPTTASKRTAEPRRTFCPLPECHGHIHEPRREGGGG